MAGVEIFTRDQFEANALPKLKGSDKPAWKPLGLVSGEYAYLVPLPNATAIEVRSTVGNAGVSADCGEDSIRCWIVDPETLKPLGGKISRWTTRKPGWGARTLEVIRALARMAMKIRTCPKCGKERVKVFKVQKDGPNKGRPFAKCWAGGKGCGFFEWLEEAKPTQAKPAAPDPCPECGGVLKREAVKKEGPTKGRPFLTCLGDGKEGCGYFKWLDNGKTIALTLTLRKELGGDHYEVERDRLVQRLRDEGFTVDVTSEV